MNSFSEKAIQALGDYYVYGLIDPRTHQFFYIGKGCGNRVFEHEREAGAIFDRDVNTDLDRDVNTVPDSDENITPGSEKGIIPAHKETLKFQTIADIKAAGLLVEKVIINDNLTEDQAFAAEAALINAFNYVSATPLSNIVAGHHSAEAMSVEEYERLYGAEELTPSDIHHRILVIKVNKLYKRGMNPVDLYDSVRGVWRISKKRALGVDYVFGVYNSLIVAVYKPTAWFVCKEAPDRLPRQDIELTAKTENRLYFIDESFEKGMEMDESQRFYNGKSISKLKVNQSAQNPVTYLMPEGSPYGHTDLVE